MRSRLKGRWVALLLLAGALGPLAGAWAQEAGTGGESTGISHVEPVTLRWANRDIAVMRATRNGIAPQERASRAVAAMNRLTDRERRQPVRVQELVMQNQRMAAVLVGDRTVFALLPGDADEAHVELAVESKAVEQRLAEALAVDRQQRQPMVLLRGTAISLAALALAVLAIWALGKLAVRLENWLLGRLQKHSESGRMNWREYAIPVVVRVLLLLRWLLYAFIALSAVVAVLKAFPLTQPLGEGVLSFFASRLHVFGRAALEALPGLMTMLLILFLTHGVAQAVGLFFDNVHNGRIRMPLSHPETALATKRLVNLLVWGVGIAICYPYIPGSKSEAFKGVSLFFGLMVSLGSAGVVSQLMSGLVVVYSRALRRGDRVLVDGIEAEVDEIGGLATKLVNIYRQEITIPNSVLIGNAIVNYTKRAETGPVFFSSIVTIGYDAPWRQVHQILLDAVAATEGFAKTPAAYVLQRALSDFYVEYEVFAALDDPMANLRRRPHIMSAFHANIQDSFNLAGVQIMSPHFEAQPDGNIVVARENWFGPKGSAAVTPVEVLKDLSGQKPPST